MNIWMKSILTALSICFVALMSGCLLGGESPSTSTASINLKGNFIDSPTKGLSYSASPSSLSGTTDTTGAFRYQVGDTVTFALDVGTASPVTIGTGTPAAPTTGGNAQLFVLSLANGLQVAQVLQSLNHSASNTYIDVGGLTMPQDSAITLNSYISSGGTVLPSGQTDVQMLAAAQASNTTAGVTFTQSGGESIATTIADLNSTITGMTATPGILLSSLLPGRTIFVSDFVYGTGGSWVRDYNFAYFSGSTTGTAYAYGDDSLTVGAQPYSIIGNQISFSAGNINTVPYADSRQGIWTTKLDGALIAFGPFNFVDTSFGPNTIAGKTFTFLNGHSGTCIPPVLDQLVINSQGTAFTENCQGSPAVVHSGTIASALSAPGVLVFTHTDDTGAATFYLGMLAGSNITNGTLGFVNANSSNGGSIDGIGGLLPFTSP